MSATDTDPFMGITKCRLRAPQSKIKNTNKKVAKLHEKKNNYRRDKTNIGNIGMHYVGGVQYIDSFTQMLPML